MTKNQFLLIVFFFFFNIILKYLIMKMSLLFSKNKGLNDYNVDNYHNDNDIDNTYDNNFNYKYNFFYYSKKIIKILLLIIKFI